LGIFFATIIASFWAKKREYWWNSGELVILWRIWCFLGKFRRVVNEWSWVSVRGRKEVMERREWLVVFGDGISVLDILILI